MKRKNYILLGGAIITVLIIVLVSAATYYQINDNMAAKIDEHSDGQWVQNNDCLGTGIFVPTKTSTEWSNFKTNAPSCIDICDMESSDTDGGNLSITAGTCTENTKNLAPCTGGFESNYTASFSDSCSGDILTEYYNTSWGTCVSYTTDCGLGLCSGGACDLCFDKFALVTMFDGTMKLIGEIKIGDRIKAFDEEKNETGFAIVKNIYHHDDGTRAMDKIVFSNEAEFTVTPNHPILTTNNEWVEVGELSVGDWVYQLNEDNQLEKVQILSIIREYSTEKVVYNLKTSLHNYFSNGILVHNKCVIFGTLIDAPNGLIRIENLKVGDFIYGTNEKGEKIKTKILKTFDKEIIVDIPGKILPNGEIVTNNHLIEYRGKKIRAGETDLEDYLISGKVYDLQTETGDYYVKGIRTWFEQGF